MSPIAKDILAVCRKLKSGWLPSSSIMGMYDVAVLGAAMKILRKVQAA